MSHEQAIEYLTRLLPYGDGVAFDAIQTLKAMVLAQQTNNSVMVSCNQYGKQSSVVSVCPIGHFNCGASPCMVVQHHSV